MRIVGRIICCTLLLLGMGCTLNKKPAVTVEQAPAPGTIVVAAALIRKPGVKLEQGQILWGKTVSGLQIGVAGEVNQRAGRLEGVRIFLRNQGRLPLKVVDLNSLDFNRKPGESAIVDFALSGGFGLPPDGVPGLLFRTNPASVIELVPRQMISTELGVNMPDRNGDEAMAFGMVYRNKDSVLQVAEPNEPGSLRTVYGVWTGEAMSELMRAN